MRSARNALEPANGNDNRGLQEDGVPQRKKTGEPVFRNQKCFSLLFSSEAVSRNLARTLVADEFIGDLLTIVELAETSAFYGRDMYEDILRAVIGLDEAVALSCVEPFYSTGRH
jgi:hypothetical protein